MKLSLFVLLMFMAVCLFGCTQRVGSSDMLQGIELCKTNLGLKDVVADIGVLDVNCKNGAQFRINTSKGRVVER